LTFYGLSQTVVEENLTRNLLSPLVYVLSLKSREHNRVISIAIGATGYS